MALGVALLGGVSGTAGAVIPRHGVAVTSAATPAQVADDGLGTTGTTTYVVDPANRVIHVSVDLTATNLVPGGATTYTYFDALGVFTLAEATNVVATDSAGRTLGTGLEPIEGTEAFAFIRVDLANQLTFQETHTIRVTYDLADQGPRSTRYTRVNPAFASILPVPFGDPGEANIRVLVPDALDVEVIGNSTMNREDAGDQLALVANAIADPLHWDATIAARDLEALERSEAGGDHDVSIAAWPGDAEWAGFVGGLARDGIPVLEEVIGQPWPLEDSVEVVETVAPYLYGYAGWYDSNADRIEIGDELEGIVVLHELAHAWFDDGMFTERWLNEGFAEEVASRTLAQLGMEAPAPEPVDPASPGAVALEDWSNPTFTSETSDEREHYGYNTSFSVIRSLTDEIGLEATALVIEGAAERRIAYQGDPDPETTRRPNDWRRFLDLAEELGGSTAIESLVATHVVPASGAAELAERAGARALLDELEAAGDGWTAPYGVRREMERWDFESATEAIEQATAILEVRDDIRAATEPLGLGDPGGLEQAYEEATDLNEVLDLAEDQLAAAEALVEADGAVAAGRDVFVAVGLIGADPEGELDEARAAFEDGDADEVGDRADEVVATIDDASGDGQVRVAGGVAALLVVAVGGVGWRRRPRVAAPAPEATAAADLWAPPPATGGEPPPAPATGWEPPRPASGWEPPPPPASSWAPPPPLAGAPPPAQPDDESR